MENSRKKVDNVNRAVNKEINKENSNRGSKEELLYSIPYKTMPITAPSNSNELPIILKDVILAVKEKVTDGKSIKTFSLYTDDGKNLAESHDDGRMIFDKEIIEELIKSQIKQIREAGYEPAGIDEDGKLETIFEMLGRQIVVMNKEQKDKLDRSNDRRRALREISSDNMDPEVEDKDEIKPNTPENENLIMNQMAKDLDIDAHKIAKISEQDDVFWENNPDIKSRNAYAVLTHSGELRIVGENNGKFEQVEGFKNSSDVAGRTTIARNDKKSLENETKNTYGSLESTRNKDYRYTLENGKYGEIKLVEQRRLHSGHIEESQKYVSREVETNNTDFSDRDLEEKNGRDITRRTFRANSTNRDSAYYGKMNGKGGISEVGDAMKKHNDEKDYTMESLASNENQRVAEAIRMIHEELEKRGIELTTKEDEKIQNKVTAYIGNTENTFCEEDAIQYANEIQIDRKAKENEDKVQKGDDEDLSRLDQIAQSRNERRRGH